MQEKGNAIHGITTFRMVMREHLDSHICIERKIVPMDYPVITRTRKAFENG